MSLEEGPGRASRALPSEVLQRGGDPAALAVIKQLYESGFVDGLVRRLQRGWNLLDRDAIEDAVADATLVLYDALADGRRVRSPEGYVFKVAKVEAQHRHDQITSRDDHYDFEADEEELEAKGGPGRDELRREAIRVARRLLPRLGQTNLVRVMSMVLDAVEAGVPDISPAEIADALGLPSPVVRQSLSRGYRRLERLARHEGLQLTFADVLDQDTAPTSDKEDDDDDE